MAASTQSFQRVIGSPNSAGAFSITLVTTGAGGTATITSGITGVVSPGDVFVAASTTGGFTANSTTITVAAVGYNTNGTGATCTFTGFTATGAATVNFTSSSTSTFNSGNSTFFASGDSQSGPTTSRFVQIQGGYTTNGTSTWTPINKISGSGGFVELIGLGASASGPFNITIKCNDVYTLNTSSGAIVSGGSANVLELAMRNGANYTTIATLEKGDAITLNGLNTVTSLTASGGTPVTVCSLCLLNSTSSDLLADVTAAITL